MAKRDNGEKPATGTTPRASSAAADAMEQKVIAFAEQLGRIVGTIQAKADGWLESDALQKQVTTVRDEASHLLEQLKGSAKKATTKATAAAAAARKAGKGRRGGG